MCVCVYYIDGCSNTSCYCSKEYCQGNEKTCVGEICFLRVSFGNYPENRTYDVDYGCFNESLIFQKEGFCYKSSSEVHYNCCTAEPECNRNLTFPKKTTVVIPLASSSPYVSGEFMTPLLFCYEQYILGQIIKLIITK